MALARKVLWIVNMDTAAQESRFIQHAQAAGANAVCVRTSSTRLPGSIAAFKALGMTVYAWRWPSVIPANTMAEANKVAASLIPAGLDGYVVDPESDGPGSNDWNRPGLGSLARDFRRTIRNAASAGFLFGTTSGCAFPSPQGKPDIPFAEFFAASDKLYPQSYWRANLNGVKTKINGGTPDKAIKRGLDAWTPRAGGKPVIPMAGEIDIVAASEITAFGARLAALGVDEGHFYADAAVVPAANLAAMRAL